MPDPTQSGLTYARSVLVQRRSEAVRVTPGEPALIGAVDPAVVLIQRRVIGPAINQAAT